VLDGFELGVADGRITPLGHEDWRRLAKAPSGGGGSQAGSAVGGGADNQFTYNRFGLPRKVSPESNLGGGEGEIQNILRNEERVRHSLDDFRGLEGDRSSTPRFSAFAPFARRGGPQQAHFQQQQQPQQQQQQAHHHHRHQVGLHAANHHGPGGFGSNSYGQQQEPLSYLYQENSNTAAMGVIAPLPRFANGNAIAGAGLEVVNEGQTLITGKSSSNGNGNGIPPAARGTWLLERSLAKRAMSVGGASPSPPLSISPNHHYVNPAFPPLPVRAFSDFAMGRADGGVSSIGGGNGAPLLQRSISTSFASTFRNRVPVAVQQQPPPRPPSPPKRNVKWADSEGQDLEIYHDFDDYVDRVVALRELRIQELMMRRRAEEEEEMRVLRGGSGLLVVGGGAGGKVLTDVGVVVGGGNSRRGSVASGVGSNVGSIMAGFSNIVGISGNVVNSVNGSSGNINASVGVRSSMTSIKSWESGSGVGSGGEAVVDDGETSSVGGTSAANASGRENGNGKGKGRGSKLLDFLPPIAPMYAFG
ncbi:hypothetical protein HDU76_010473, partial [Blyttiomyces sp. JEL0837]